LDERQVTLAAVAGAHGVGGEVRLKLFAESVDSLARHQTVNVGGRALRGSLVTVPRAALPPLAEGEYYHVDLIGLPCVDPDGEALGTVVAVENFGAGDVIEIERSDGRRTMVPLREGIADPEQDRIVVDPLFLT
jgi:16S rRNA processing protein RimM